MDINGFIAIVLILQRAACKLYSAALRGCNNYLEGGNWEIGEICPKTKSYNPSYKAKIDFNPLT